MASWRDRWQQFQQWRARRFLAANPTIAAQTLRQHPDLAAQAAYQAFERIGLTAAGGMPGRETQPWPILGQLGTGGHRPLQQSLPKPTPFNLRRFAFAQDTEVLTQHGWKVIAEISTEDCLATVNIETGEAEWQHPLKTFVYRIDGEMIRFLSKDVDALVTPEHMMLGRFRTCNTNSKMSISTYKYSALQLIQASEVESWVHNHTSSASAFEIPFVAHWAGSMPITYDPKTDTVPVQCYQNAGKRSQFLPLQAVRVSLKDLVAFFGIYIAEGSSEGSYYGMDTTANSSLAHHIQAMFVHPIKKPKSYRVRIAQSPGEKFADIEALLSQLPWKFYQEKGGFVVYDKGLWEMVHPLGNTYTKYIPQWIKDLPKEYLRIFIDWAIKGDGIITEDGFRRYYTVSKCLADDMQEVFQRSGTSAKITKKIQNGLSAWNKDVKRSAPVYCIQERTRAWYGVHGKHVTREEFHGYAYCMDIPNKTVYVRRNGKAFWCGRSEYPPARRAINKISNKILDQPWTVDLLPRPGVKKATPTLEQEIRMAIAHGLLERPNTQETFRMLAEAVLEDILVGGFGAIEVQRWAENPLRPVLLYTVDGQSIRINTQWTGQDPAEPRYAQSLGYAGISVGTQEVVQLRDDELLYIRLNVRSHTPFGFGYLESAFIAVNAWLGAFEYAERRASNATPNFALFLGENVTPQQVKYWQAYWEQQIEGYGKIPIIGGGRSPTVLPFTTTGEDQLYLKWQEFLIRIIAMAFGLSPFSLGLERDVNRNTAEESSDADWETAAPVANTMADVLTYKLLHQILGWHDLRFHWIVKDQDEKRQAEVLTLQNDMDALTLGELRELYERPLYGDARDQMTRSEYAVWLQSRAQGAMPGEPAFGGPPLMRQEEEHEEQEEASEPAFAFAPPDSDEPAQRNGRYLSVP